MAGISTDIDVCNVALGAHLGKPTITAYNDGSSEGKLCLQHYDFSRQLALEASPWTFARGYAALAEVANDLSDEWDYAYDVPNTALKIHTLVDAGMGIERNVPPIPYFLANDKIYTNIQDAWLLYTQDNEDVASWSNKFKDAVAMQLAFRISATFVRRRSDRVILSQSYDNMINLAIELDAAQELTTYPQNDSGYNQARGAGNVNAYDGRSPDGSRFWS